MNELNGNSEIYIACNPNIVTGGPELLHQLAYKLKLGGFNAKMYYLDEFTENPVPDAYKVYNNDYVNLPTDSPDNVLIVPETLTPLLKRYKNIRKVIWWLSVDNYYNSIKENNKGLKGKVKLALNYNQPLDFKKIIQNKVSNFVQSKYASEHLKQKKITDIYYLSDYLNKDFLNENSELNDTTKVDIIAFNPKKGYEFTKKIIESAPHLKFVPIINMSRDQVYDLLRKSKVYIDFGNHPGKDRIPREAVMCGCCIITGKQGSAKYWEDVSISDEFKFENSNSEINKIVERIEYCLNNYQTEILKFKEYRQRIMGEENAFENNIREIFKYKK